MSAKEPEVPPFAELLERVRQGDAEAKEMLFSRLGDEDAEGGVILSLARQVLPQKDRARDFVESRDLVQSALRSGWLDVSRFRGESEGEFFRWLHSIMHHKLHRVIRRKRPQLGLPDPGGDVDPDSTPPDQAVLADMIREEVMARLQDELARLPDDQREVLELRLRGLNAPEIARALGLTPAAVRKRESRAVAKLREQMG